MSDTLGQRRSASSKAVQGFRGSVSVSMTTSLSPFYLRSAARFARRAHTIERHGLDISGAEIEFNDEEYRSYAASAIAFSTFFIEAALYEFLTVAVRQPQAFDEPLGEEQIVAIEEYWQDTSGQWQVGVLDRYHEVLKRAKRGSFDKGANAAQDVKLLVSLRNALFHYKPIWEGEEVPLRKVVVGLRTKITRTNPFHTSSVEFPNLYLSHGSAVWAVAAVIEFYNQFCQEIRLKKRYESSDQSLSLISEKSPE